METAVSANSRRVRLEKNLITMQVCRLMRGICCPRKRDERLVAAVPRKCLGYYAHLRKKQIFTTVYFGLSVATTFAPTLQVWPLCFWQG